MWKNNFNKVYFYFRKLSYYNIHERGYSNTSEKTKKLWATNGRSTLIGPEVLGGWHNDTL